MKKKKNNRNKVKLIYKILLVLGVFIGSCIFFASDIKETLFEEELKTTAMKEASFPLVSFEVEGEEMNLLRGHAANLDAQVIRECITPVTSERSITVNIKTSENDVKKLKYQIFTVDGREKESDDLTVLEDSNGKKRITIPLRENYEVGDEYILKLTLITNTSKRIYYYSRLKYYENDKLHEKLDFINNFHKSLLDKNGRHGEDLLGWLEPSRTGDNTNFANVNIRSRLSLVNYGELSPDLVYEQPPTITEFYENYASFRIDYVVGVDTELGREYYRLEEDYRIGISGSKIYLYNYERSMEEFFDISNFSKTKREFKLGICNEDAVTGASSPEGKYQAFVYGGELIFYDTENNAAVKAFSFGVAERNFEREIFRNYDIKILNIRDDGTMDFYIAGYMNAGEYEGRTGIVLYSYDYKENLREEKLYMPINSSYQILTTDLADFAYYSEDQVFYFSIYNNLYSYKLASGELEIIAKDIPEGELFFCESEAYIAWNEKKLKKGQEYIRILHLDSGQEYAAESPTGQMKLFGLIGNNIVYGVGKEEDGLKKRDGSIELPYYRLVIANSANIILKDYTDPGYYVTGIDIGENIITLSRVRKNEEGTAYLAAESDTILNNPEKKAPSINVVKHVTDRMLTEYYIAVPENTVVDTVPSFKSTRNRVLNHETIARLPEPQEKEGCYYAYSFGKVVAASANAASVIAAANKAVGTVINRDGRLIWERGIMTPRNELTGVAQIKATEELSSIKAAMQMIAAYRKEELDTSGFSPSKTSIFEFMNDNMKPYIIDMTGAELDEVLYCTYRKHPVIAIRGNGEACVILGYDPSHVIIYDPIRNAKNSILKSDAIKDFKKGGNIFISFVG
ncbi:MAG: hypothetical protein IKW90_11915 [Lachnospiraceae bacterium]|nr:hypothetical protein [Lachnospiraceae bacterium]